MAFWNNVPTVLSAAADSRVPESCIYSQSAPEDGWNCRPKNVEQDYKNQ